MSSSRRKAAIVFAGVLLVGILSVAIDWGTGGEVQAVVRQASEKEQGQTLADSIMAQWKTENPDRASDWIAEEKERHTVQPPADNSDL